MLWPPAVLAGAGNGGSPLPWEPRELVAVTLSCDLEPTGFPRDRDLEPSLSRDLGPTGWSLSCDLEPIGWSGSCSEASRMVLGSGDGCIVASPSVKSVSSCEGVVLDEDAGVRERDRDALEGTVRLQGTSFLLDRSGCNMTSSGLMVRMCVMVGS